MERREIGELHEEIATMQTLYQYRTYSVDSSEDSDVEEEQHQVNKICILFYHYGIYYGD